MLAVCIGRSAAVYQLSSHARDVAKLRQVELRRGDRERPGHPIDDTELLLAGRAEETTDDKLL